MHNLITKEINSHIPHVSRYARYLSDTDEQAEELVQKTIEKSLSRNDGLTSVENLRGYLFTILYNLRNDQLREKLRLQNHVAIEDIIIADNALSQSQRQSCMEVLDHISTLAQAHQEILQLLIIEELSYDEISAVLEIAIGTVMSRISRARKALRVSLDIRSPSAVTELLET